MAEQEGKLQALRRAYELEEQSAIEEVLRIDAVARQRMEALDRVNGDIDGLCQELEALRAERRRAILSSGDGNQLSAISSLEDRLRLKLQSLKAKLEECELELARAREREAAAEAEVMAVRIEKKRVERFLENRDKYARIKDAALEEVIEDELNFFRRK